VDILSTSHGASRDLDSHFRNYDHPHRVRIGRRQMEQSLRTQREHLVLSGLVRPGHWHFVGCYFPASKVGDASKVAPVNKLSLLLVAIFAAIFLHERPTSREWLRIIMVGAGVLILGFKK
jgi:uncharacterized membrane protein